MTKKIVHVESRRNSNYDHPLNFLSEKYEAEAVDDSGSRATGYGSTRSGAIANAVTKVQR